MNKQGNFFKHRNSKKKLNEIGGAFDINGIKMMIKWRLFLKFTGHSLGAHIVGSAGRNLYYKTGKLVPRITGLDPASKESFCLISRKKTKQFINLTICSFFSIFFWRLIQIIVKLSDPCFNSGEELTGLSRGDAEFVLIIHSNSGGLGKRDPLGKRWVNYR